MPEINHNPPGPPCVKREENRDYLATTKFAASPNLMVVFRGISALFLCLIYTCLGVTSLWAQATPPDQHIIWTHNETDLHNLNFSSKRQGHWEPPETIAESANPIIVPTLATRGKDTVWAAWTELQGTDGRLRYRIKQGGKWKPVRGLATATSSDMAPSMIIDSTGVAWMVWSGTDQTDDDIYFSRYVGNQWQPPQRVNADDEWPDILPEISIDTQNQITVTWLGFNGDRYVQYAASWTGRNWSSEAVGPPLSIESQPIIQNFPNFIPENSQGSFLQDQTVRRFKTIE